MEQLYYGTLFDTETSGFKENGLLQIAGVCVDSDINTIQSFNFLVIPQGFEEVEAGAAAIHGHTMDRCTSGGIPLAVAMSVLKRLLEKSKLAICHNYGYDSKVVAKACATLGCEDFLSRQNNLCTMLALVDICQIPQVGRRGFKWPKLQEAHKFCFGEEFEDAHDAMADIAATQRVLRWIKENHPEKLPRV